MMNRSCNCSYTPRDGIWNRYIFLGYSVLILYTYVLHRLWIPEVLRSKRAWVPATWLRTSTENKSKGWTTLKCCSSCCPAATKPPCGPRRWSSRPSRPADGVGNLARASWHPTPDTEASGSRTTRTGTRGRSARTYRPARADAGKSRRCSGGSAPSARPTISRYVRDGRNAFVRTARDRALNRLFNDFFIVAFVREKFQFYVVS
jgi:hypothetical protein